MTVLRALFVAFGLAVLLLGLQGAVYFPLTVAYEVWKRRALRRIAPFQGRVSVVVPAYQEERTIRDTVETVLASRWPDLEAIVVDDGSRDGTSAAVADLAAAGRIVLVRQENAGKAAALNTGIALGLAGRERHPVPGEWHQERTHDRRHACATEHGEADALPHIGKIKRR